ncbi:DUF3168 domain-containing protein [Rhodovulum kholense]|uniref:Uncharacterized protein DUF3168 n=1 Tax=Rhodovulum kholense TaxID=453584 RepID=A0A8E2VGI8_9RHOB|nr:DUF3168 domain-containing protein [Rhodovulum kholense]PTW43897.1 uncharacterized protein DUF3168 [Rhodovulum kholense]
MSFETAAQTAIFAALDGALSCPVYDTPPALPEGMPDSGFPYVVIGDDTLVADEADDVIGAQVTVTIHFWSRAPGNRQVKALMGEAFGLLHRAALTAPGFKLLDCLREFATVSVGPDGKTRHGVQRYRIIMHKE